VKSADGRSLKSPHVVFNQAQDKIWSDTTFEFVSDGQITTGTDGFETNTKLTRKICKGQCTVRTSVSIPK
jgi:hypothetical protein